jgi:hypothetical protein
LWRVASVGMPALAAAVLAAWLLLGLGLSDWWALVGASKVAALTAVMLSLRRPVPHELVWDGQQWLADGHPGTLQLMLDLGPVMLLRLQPAEGTAALWLPLAASEAASAWGPLRAAIHSRPLPAPPAPRPPEHQAP